MQIRNVWIAAGLVALALSQGLGQTGIFSAGKRYLYMHCEGHRHGPVVILSTGLYREASDWKLVMPQIARFTQVCSYDREGLGQSTVDHEAARPESESMDEQIEDLKNLLTSAHVLAPYLLVGHSEIYKGLP